jgi:hypothetical protein
MKAQTTKRKSPTGLPLDESALRAKIAQKAYELYEKRGRIPGMESENWLEAERIVLGELKTQANLKGRTPAQRKRTRRKPPPSH